MAERGKPGRPPNKPPLDKVLDAIEKGDYDEDLLALLNSIHQRQDALKARVMERVKEVFGPEAEVVVGASKSIPQATHRRNPNPFIEKQRGVVVLPTDGISEQQVLEAAETGGMPGAGVEDSLSHLDDTERRMSQEAPLDIERRGAMISGLHSSDIAE